MSGPQRRWTALDGLRGVAALVVVVHHGLLLQPSLAQAYGSSGGAPPAPASPWWLGQSPVHLVWAGSEAVHVFFVLSGFVLVLPFLSPAARAGAAGRRWAVYYPQRLLRLYLPVAAAVLLSAALAVLVPRVERPQLSWAYAGHVQDVSWQLVGRATALVFGPTSLNGPLWSLKWEVVFSLLLPLYVVVARRATGRPRLAVALALALLTVMVVGATAPVPGHAALYYLPMFAVGSLMAAWKDALAARAAALPRSGALVVGGVTLVLFQVTWLLPGSALAGVASALGAALVVFAALGIRSWVCCLRLAPVLWLGKVSFSLYLVHDPVLITVAALVDTGSSALDVAVVTVVGLAVSLVVAAVFYRLVEMPSHRLSRRLGRRAAVTAGR